MAKLYYYLPPIFVVYFSLKIDLVFTVASNPFILHTFLEPLFYDMKHINLWKAKEETIT